LGEKKHTGIGIKPQKVGVKPKSITPQQNYSTVTEWFGRVFIFNHIFLRVTIFLNLN